MQSILDLDRWPVDALDGERGGALAARCRDELAAAGMFSLEALIRPEALRAVVDEVEPLFETASFTHAREHNIYFDDDIGGLEAGHPALSRVTTVNRTICGDQIPASTIARVYEWQPLIDFLAAAMEKPRLHPMADPLGRLNVMAYRAGERLNWHFDRAEFTITVLLQAPVGGGDFQYRSGLRSEADPNYDGVGRLLAGLDDRVQTLPLAPGTLNVFKGKNTAHRVTPVEGARPRIIAVFSYYEAPDVTFSDTERLLGFYGRTRCSIIRAAPTACVRPDGAWTGSTGSSCGRTIHRSAKCPSARSWWWSKERSRAFTGVYATRKVCLQVPLFLPLGPRALPPAGPRALRTRQAGLQRRRLRNLTASAGESVSWRAPAVLKNCQDMKLYR